MGPLHFVLKLHHNKYCIFEKSLVGSSAKSQCLTVFGFGLSVSVAEFFWIGFGLGGWLSVSIFPPKPKTVRHWNFCWFFSAPYKLKMLIWYFFRVQLKTFFKLTFMQIELLWVEIAKEAVDLEWKLPYYEPPRFHMPTTSCLGNLWN